ncbi:hypothetical protein FHS42_002103 [Streptomyces zagrosensis]|uniref:Uncharacterized protein n=1 Tax=Streptomyces zagrosensis TaxID=1042984 RepID=A0A7W9Q8B6_9ACTN|nr:hypothetical protein [Streptomyces zagrosensis]
MGAGGPRPIDMQLAGFAPVGPVAPVCRCAAWAVGCEARSLRPRFRGAQIPLFAGCFWRVHVGLGDVGTVEAEVEAEQSAYRSVALRIKCTELKGR